MRNFLLFTCLAFTLASCATSPRSELGDFKAGKNAYLKKDYTSSFRFFKKSARAGNVKSQYWLAHMYLQGMGVAKDSKEAIVWYKKAARQGSAKAAYRLGSLYRRGEEVSKDEKQGVMFLRMAAEQGHSNAQNSLAVFLGTGRRGRKKENREESEKWLKKAAAQGNQHAISNLESRRVSRSSRDRRRRKKEKWFFEPVGTGQNQIAPEIRCSFKNRSISDEEVLEIVDDKEKPIALHNLAVMYALGVNREKNIKKAAHFFKLSASLGQAESQLALGYLYSKGMAVKQSWEETAKWYKKAANQNFLKAYKMLGDLHVYGDGVSKDEQESFKWYKKAAEEGLVEAMERVGYMYSRTSFGGSIESENRESLRWHRLAAEKGYVKSQLALGGIYDDGQDGVPEDADEALKWFRLAVEQGEGHSNIASMYHDGIGVPKDFIKAYAWYNLAIEHGDGVAVTFRNMLVKEMTVDQIEQGRKLITQLRKTILAPDAQELSFSIFSSEGCTEGNNEKDKKWD